ncbi:hypothetical protein LCGC14_0609790 [marine sediment metagenome]|uniref:Uncharacterized protein n=1 Tax=marine sediment metagenome TaxID=412755 RepID=A0A0F9UGF0_9ZZZZ
MSKQSKPDGAQAQSGDQPAVTVEAFANAFNQLDGKTKSAIMQRVGQSPSTEGFGLEQLRMILQTVGQDTAQALKRAGQRENPNYPDMSVYNPRGKFDHEGHPQKPKLTFEVDTYYVNVLLGRKGGTSDLNVEGEIELCNRIATEGKDREAHKGRWTAKLFRRGDRQVLDIQVPCEEPDDRMGIPSFTAVLLTLLEGEESVNPATMVAQMKAMREEIADLRARDTQRMPQDAPVEAPSAA